MGERTKHIIQETQRGASRCLVCLDKVKPQVHLFSFLPRQGLSFFLFVGCNMAVRTVLLLATSDVHTTMDKGGYCIQCN